ncbi:hypothetical protein F5B22DRAFT_13944 [Xylaria bambusicola]|uniref:uncharacterized protein n=1 Tax=Xylaria bambusicola TaxID=326684 RepID=UPI0020074695|nr:uncharacterized protein F5B22DRAFT_13944 [Xylaria bambusicola]KAI0527974.1 hypothetical protein F5B22DRAFT_13944 [Xylaria bambusicola]
MGSTTQLFKSYIHCLNEGRWYDLPNFVSFPYKINDATIDSPEIFAEYAILGRVQLDVDAITADEQTQRLGASLISNLYPHDKTKSKPTEFKQTFIWAADGKIYQVATLKDKEDLRRQRDEPGYVRTPDLIATYTPQTSGGRKLLRTELEDTYRAYIGCINAQTMATELPRFCHAHVVHNARRLSLEEYRGLMEEAFTAVPDIIFGIDTVVPDESAQRVAVRLEFTGTPTGAMKGAEPTGKSVRFYEYVTYAFQDGKIDRVWSIVDWESYRQQLRQE